MAATVHTNEYLDESYVLTDCAYQEIDTTSRESESIYDVATTSESNSTFETVKRQTKKLYPEKIEVKCLVTAVIIVSCIAVVSAVIAITALVVAVIALTNNQATSQLQPPATIQTILERLSKLNTV